MARFPDRFLDDVRNAMSVHAYVSRTHKLRKVGAGEYQAIDDHSLTVNENKNLWYDFGKGKQGGDIFDFERFKSGCTFEQAVERVAQAAGVPLPRAAAKAAPAPRQDEPPADEEPPPHPGGNGNGYHAPASNKRMVDAYDFVDAEGSLVYQVVRFESVEDGKKRKSTPKRRPFPDDPQRWIWGLDAGVYVRAPSGDWLRDDADRKKKWPQAERRTFDACAPTLYRLPEVLEECRQPVEDQRPVFLPEGEKDAKNLSAWGLLATTNINGTNGWEKHFAAYLEGADVIIPIDNDVPGRRFGHAKAAALRGIARRTRLLDFRAVWPACPEGGDFTDWRDHGGGNLDKLFRIVDGLKDWTPEIPESTFNAQRYVDMDKPAKELSWLVKNVMTDGEVSIWFGQYGSGKSFLITDCALAIARGQRWMGNVAKWGLVIYQAGEGGLGLRKRLRAYRQHHRLPAGDDVPFVLLPSRVDIFSSDADVDRLIAEIKAWAGYYNETLRLVVLDTLNAASPGADENNGKDIGPVLNRARKIANETGAHVALVDHTPKDGLSPRGWSGKMGNVDNAIMIARTGQFETDADGKRHEIRTWTVAKQKDEADGRSRRFFLRRIVLGKDAEEDEITSCVVEPLGGADESTAPAGARRDVVPPGYYDKLNPANEDLLRCLVRAIHKRGRTAPPGVEAPQGALVVSVGEWQDEVIDLAMGHEEVTATLRERVKKRIQRACHYWDTDRANLVGKSKEYVWKTSRKVHMIDPPPPAPRANPTPIVAPGEDQQDFGDYLAGEHGR